MTKTIEVTVSSSCEIKIDAIGFKGADCDQATAFLELALGVETERRKKPEFYQQSKAKHQQKLGE